MHGNICVCFSLRLHIRQKREEKIHIQTKRRALRVSLAKHFDRMEQASIIDLNSEKK